MDIYLAGPMSGLTYEGASSWREKALAHLTDAGHTVLSPLRGQEDYFIRAKGIIPPIKVGTGLVSDQASFKRDRWDVQRCDVILAYLKGAGRVSVGTMFELAWASALDKYVVVVLDDNKDNPHNHLFVHQAATIVVNSLEDAYEVIDTLQGE